MSGFEIVGVVLGGLPIAIGVLKAYEASWMEIKGLYHHAEEVSKFYRDLDTESTIFVNTCQNLLDQNISAGLMRQLVSPSSTENNEKLSSTQVQQILQSKLRPNTIKSFLENVEEMNSLINDLSTKYPKEPPNHEGSLHEYSRRVRKTLKFRTLKTFHETNLERARRINKNLQMLVKDGGYTETEATKLQTTKAIKFYRVVHRHAIRLYKVLREKLDQPGCTCTSPHDTALQLEVQDVTTAADFNYPENHGGEEGIRLRFRAFMKMAPNGTTEIWQGMDIEPADSDLDEYESRDIGGDTRSQELMPEISGLSLTIPEPPTYTPNRPKNPLQHVLSVGKSVRKEMKKQVRFFSSPNINMTASGNCAVNLMTTGGSKVDFVSLSSTITTATTTVQSTATSSKQAAVTPTIDILCKHFLQAYDSEKASYAANSFAYLIPSCTPSTRLRIRPTPASTIFKSLLPPSFDCLFKHTVTLHELLQRTCPAGKLSLKIRLQLAANLACSVLQLHPSDWVSEEWSSKDIVFLQGSKGQILLDTPLAATPFRIPPHGGDPSTSLTSYSSCLPNWCNTNKTLLSLGIVLIELWNLRRFEEYEKEAMDIGIGYDIPAEKVKDMGRLERRIHLAIHLSDDLKDNAGREYESAVRRCVRGLDHAERGFDNAEYREAVYAGVVWPLKEALEKTFPGVIRI